MNVKKVLEEYMIQNGYTALYSGECACFVDDLFPCHNENCDQCELGVRIDCASCDTPCENPYRDMDDELSEGGVACGWCEKAVLSER